MSSTQDDTAFFKTFLGVMGLLTVGTIVMLAIAMFAGTFEQGTEQARVELERERTVQRLQPIGAVRMDGDAMPVDVAGGGSDEEAEADNGEVASGSDVYQSACTACHSQGVMDAPKSGDSSAWGALLSERGLDGLVENAINGKGAMPARGGDPSLSDEEVRNAVVHMLEESGQSVD
ncbi:MAG: c-type cytochrome [Aquisalimonadaceae bacterium]